MVALAEEKETPPRVSREAYLEWESQQETKHEYYDGVIIEMAGASPEHIRINGNVNGLLFIQLLDSACQEFPSDMRCFAPRCDRYYYPDASVVCEEPEYEAIQGVRSLLNPILIVEVLSPTSEKSDRGEKFECYKTLPSLRTYVLISQEAPRIEVYERQAAGEWMETVSEGLDATAILERIGCELRLKSVYARVDFSGAESD